MAWLACGSVGILTGPQLAQYLLMDLPAAAQPATQCHVMVKG